MQQRNYAVDNVRTLMVLFVLLLHAGCAYATSTWWWHVQDAKHLSVDLLLLIMDNSALPVLFFLSGTLVSRSFDRHGCASFIGGKMRRLGLPVLVLSTFYLPTLVYYRYLLRHDTPMSFWAYWRQWMGTFTDWNFDMINSTEAGMHFADFYSPHHLWFVSVLLVFMLGYALWRVLRLPALPRRVGFAGRVGIGAAGMVLGLAAVNVVAPDWAWARLGPFFLVQPVRLPVYGAAFVMGILLRDRLTLERPVPGPLWLWGLLWVLEQGGMAAAAGVFLGAPEAATWPMALAHGALRMFIVLACLGLFLSLGYRWWRTAAPWQRSLNASSYDIYLLHMPLTVFTQAAMVPMALPVGLKLILAFVVPLGLCWGASRTLVTRGRLVSATALTAFFMGFCLLHQGAVHSVLAQARIVLCRLF